jgi:hypothetical protein
VNFIHPAYLLLLVGVSIPVLLHMFGRRPARTVVLPTIEILRGAVDLRRKRSRLREILLMILRGSLLAALTLAVARPLIQSRATSPAPRSRNVLVLIDDTESMSGRKGEKTLLTRAKERAEEIVARSAPGDRFEIDTLVGGGDPPGGFTDDPFTARRRIEDVRPTSRGGNILEALARRCTGEPTEIRVLTDGTQAVWKGAFRGSCSAEIRVEDMSDGVPLSNTALSETEWAFDDGGTEPAVVLNVRAIHSGETRGTETLTLEIERNGKWEPRERKLLSGGEAGGTVPRFRLPVPQEDILGRLKIDGDDLAADNLRYFRIPGSNRSPVAILNGDPRPDPRDDASSFVLSALSAAEPWTFEDLRRSSLEKISTLVLADTGNLPTKRALDLVPFLQRGGGLIAGVGGTYADGAFPSFLPEIFPWRFRSVASAPTGDGLSLLPPDENGPLALLRPNWGSSLGRARFLKWILTEPPPPQDVLLRFENGMPALLVGKTGRGKVMLWASTFGRGWNDAATTAGYTALLRRMVALVRPDVPRNSGLLRVPVASVWSPRSLGEGVHIARILRIDTPTAVDSRPEEWSVPDESGLFELTLSRQGTSERILAESVPDDGESDVSRVEISELTKRVEPLRLKWGGGGGGLSTASPSVSSSAAESGGWLALFCLVIFLLESVLAGRLPGSFTRRAAPLALALIFLPGIPEADAFGDHSAVSVARIVPDARDNASPLYQQPLRYALERGEELANLKLNPRMVPVRLSDASLYDFPFLYWNSDHGIGSVSDEEVARLRRHLALGGLLFLDDASAEENSAFRQAARLLVKRLFPDLEISRTPDRHAIFQSYYLISSPAGRRRGAGLESIDVGHRTVLFLFSGDLAGALEQDSSGRFLYDMDFIDRTAALRFTLNLLMYALTLDYKRDQIHIPFILERRR